MDNLLVECFKTTPQPHALLLCVLPNSSEDMRMLFTHGCHFSFGIYLQTKPVANEMQGRSSTLGSKHVTL